MSLATYALTTRARFKAFADITADNAALNAVIDSIINSASKWIENYCQRTFARTTYTNEVYDGGDDRRLMLKNYPIIGSVTAQYRSTIANDDSWEDLDSDDYFVNATSGMLEFPRLGNEERGWRFTRGTQNYRVTYTAGYYLPQDALWTEGASTALPADLEYACWKLSLKVYESRRGGSDVGSESIGDYSVTVSREGLADKEIRDILDTYARREDV